MTRRAAVAAACALSFAAAATPAIADDLTLLCAGAMKAPVSALLAARDPSLPHVDATYATAGAIRERLAAGERPDVLIAPSDVTFALMKEQRIDVSTRRPLGQTEVGIAVRDGAPAPAIDTPDALRATLLAARRIVIVDPAKGTSGRLMNAVFRELGVEDRVRDKLLLLDGGMVVEAVARGDADLGFQQVPEILPVAGVRLIGTLPGDLKRLTRYDIATVAGTPHRRDAEALEASFETPAARDAIAKSGFTPAR